MEEKMYKAKIDIGGYKAGEEVPEDKAIVWAGMYVESPVEKVDEESSAPVENKDSVKPDALAPEEPTAESVNAMHDDYLNRNADVVKKALKDDALDKSTLESLLRLENSGKKRKDVIKAIKFKIEALD
jgi:hypothetical protein